MILYNQILIQTSMSKLQGTSPCVMGPFVYAKRMITDIDAKIKFPGFRSSDVLRKDYPSPFGEFSPLFSDVTSLSIMFCHNSTVIFVCALL